MMRRLAFATVMLLCHPSSADDVDQQAGAALLAADLIECVFPQSAQGDWGLANEMRSSPIVESGKGKPLRFMFGGLDSENMTASMFGGNGSGKVMMTATKEGLTFLELTNSGNINLTTVFMNRRVPGTKAQFPAVHSRHVVISGSVMPSQWYGDCGPAVEQIAARQTPPAPRAQSGSVQESADNTWNDIIALSERQTILIMYEKACNDPTATIVLSGTDQAVQTCSGASVRIGETVVLGRTPTLREHQELGKTAIFFLSWADVRTLSFAHGNATVSACGETLHLTSEQSFKLLATIQSLAPLMEKATHHPSCK